MSEPPNPPSTADGEKKKKKTRKSKHKEHSSPAAPENDVESPAQQDEELSRPTKRKHESEHEHKKKKKKKHHVAENNVNGASVSDAERDQDQPLISQPEEPATEKPPNPMPNGVANPTVPTPSSQANSVGYETTGELKKNGQPKKQRGSRIGGKKNLKVGFFVPDEVERLEKFKLEFCNFHHLPGQKFDEMVQHSERDGGQFPCPSSITSKNEFWADIYGVLPDRDRRSVYRFMRRHFQDTMQKPHEWTPEQEDELVALHAEHGPKWTYIAKLLGRSDDDVTQRWKNKLEHRGTMNRGPWSEEELRSFLEAMRVVWEGYRQILHDGAGKDMYEMDEKLVGWGGVSSTMKHVRSRQQCADKWRKIRKAVMAKRAAGFPDAVFDCDKAAKQHTRWNERAAQMKSKEFVTEDDDDNEGNVGDDSLPTSSATTPAPKFGFADQQKIIAMVAQATEEASAEISSSPHHGTQSNAEHESEVNDPPKEPDTSAATVRGKSSKKRKRVEAEEQPEPEPEMTEEPSPSADKQSKRERKREKKRKKKEKKEREERERAAAQQAAESEKKAKKHKKSRKSTDAVGVVETPAAATPDKKRKKKHRKSDTEPNGIANGVTESSNSPGKKHKQ